MKIKRNRLRNKTFKHIEQEFFSYQETKKQMELKRQELTANALYRSSLNVQEGGRSNMPGEPTANIAVRLVEAEREDKLYKNMVDTVQAIEYVYETANETEKKFMRLYYFTRPQVLTLEGVSQKMYISVRHLWTIRYQIAYKFAVQLGWW